MKYRRFEIFVKKDDFFQINKSSYINPEHIDYFKFVGRLIAKAIFEHKYLGRLFNYLFFALVIYFKKVSYSEI